MRFFCLTCFICLLFPLLFGVHAHAQPGWQWAKQVASGPGSRSGSATATNAAGNVYVAGTFPGLVAEFNSAGTLVWTASGVTAPNASATAVAADAAGNVYITGYFMTTPAIFGTDTLYPSAYATAFIARFNAAGQPVWARSARGTTSSSDLGTAIIVDSEGNIVVTGNFTSDSLVIGATTLINSQPTNNDIFLARYNAAGNLLWARRAGNSTPDEACYLAAGPAGSCYLFGSYSFTSMVLDTITLPATAAIRGLFLARFAADGSVIWARNSMGTGSADARAIAVGPSGEIVLTGSYDHDLQFGGNTLTGPGSANAFLARYTAAGAPVWGRHAGTNAQPGALAIDATGNIFLGGSFGHIANAFFPSATLGTANIQDPFLAFYSPAGDNKAALKLQTSASVDISGVSSARNYLHAMSAGTSGDIYLAGSFDCSTITFGPDVLTNTTGSGADMFIARFSGFNTAVNAVSPVSGTLNIFPNPASGIINISLAGQPVHQVEVINAVGRSVYSASPAYPSPTLRADLSHLPPGIYLVRASGAAQYAQAIITLVR